MCELFENCLLSGTFSKGGPSIITYVDKMRWVGVPKMPIFVRLMGKNVHVEEVGRWSKKGKIMFMVLLNDPQPKSS